MTVARLDGKLLGRHKYDTFLETRKDALSLAKAIAAEETRRTEAKVRLHE